MCGRNWLGFCVWAETHLVLVRSSKFTCFLRVVEVDLISMWIEFDLISVIKQIWFFRWWSKVTVFVSSRKWLFMLHTRTNTVRSLARVYSESLQYFAGRFESGRCICSEWWKHFRRGCISLATTHHRVVLCCIVFMYSISTHYWWGLLVLLSNPWIFRLSLPFLCSKCLKSLQASGLSWGHAVASGDYILWHVHGFINSIYWCVGMYVLKWTVTCTRRRALDVTDYDAHSNYLISVLCFSHWYWKLGICRVLQRCWSQAPAEFKNVGVYDSLSSGEREKHTNSQK